MSTILVLGATGTVGQALVPQLRAAGHQVRRATRQPGNPGDVAVDLLTGHGLPAALDGADALFLLSPPGHTNQDALLGPVIAQAVSAGVRKAVLMTAMGADADPNGPMRRAELALEASGLEWNVIRPNWFMQNFNTFWVAGIRAASVIQLPTGTGRGSFIDARDIADTAAVLLTSSTHAGRAFDLTGGAALDHHEVAAILSTVTGRTIRYEDITPDAFRPMLLSAGLPAGYVEFLIVILGYFKLGAAERVTDAVSRITGHAPRDFAAYAAEYRAAFG